MAASRASKHLPTRDLPSTDAAPRKPHGPRPKVRSALVPLLAAVTVLGGCTTLFGDFELASPNEDAASDNAAVPPVDRLDTDRGTDAIRPADASFDPPPAEVTTWACDAGERRCVGPELWVCDDNRKGFLRIPCESSALCNVAQGICVAAACKAGSVTCKDGNLLRCRDDLSGWVVEQQCATDALCDATARACLPALCSPNEMRCSANKLEGCNSSRSGWNTLRDCPSGSYCNAKDGSCIPCVAGQYRCQATNLVVCNADGTGVTTKETCATPELCDAAAGRCIPPACAVKQHRCVGARLEECNAARTGFTQDGSPCVSEAFCDADLARCRECLSGTRRCSGNAIQACGPTGNWFFQGQCDPTTQVCDANSATCVVVPRDAGLDVDASSDAMDSGPTPDVVDSSQDSPADTSIQDASEAQPPGDASGAFLLPQLWLERLAAMPAPPLPQETRSYGALFPLRGGNDGSLA